MFAVFIYANLEMMLYDHTVLCLLCTYWTDTYFLTKIIFVIYDPRAHKLI